MDEEILLSTEEINYILKDTQTNIIAKYQGIRLLSSEQDSYLTIVSITDNNNLILIKGHRYTGYIHIKMRHNFWNENVSWRKENNNLFVDNPTPFPKEIPPMYFTRIADEVYSPDNLVTSKDGGKFEFYEGVCSMYSTTHKYRLLVYKDTRIIHTLYPLDNNLKKPKTKGFNFARGEVTIQNLPKYHSRLISIPYYNSNLEYKYVISIGKHYDTNIESIYILVLGENRKKLEKHFVGELPLKVYPYPDKEAKYYQYLDMTSIENIIKQLDRELNKAN